MHAIKQLMDVNWLCCIFGHSFKFLSVNYTTKKHVENGKEFFETHWDWKCRRCGLLRLNGRIPPIPDIKGYNGK